MSMTISVTNQWQIYIPEGVRQALAWTKPGKAKLELKGKGILLTPQRSGLMKLAGKYKSLVKKNKPHLETIRDFIDYSQL